MFQKYCLTSNDSLLLPHERIRAAACDVNYKFSGGAGDVDIMTTGYNIEVKSGGKMKLNQSLKNAEYAKQQGKGYILFMPKATDRQIYDASKNGIQVIKSESKLKQTIGR